MNLVEMKTDAQESRNRQYFDTIEDSIVEIAKGNIVIVVDDEDRENEGDLTMAAEKASPESINFMAKYGRGLICLPMMGSRLETLGLNDMVNDNTSRFGTAFTVSIDARENITTGISAFDRAHTIQVSVNPKSGAADLVKPGHVFPLKAREGGVLKRAGQTEAAVDLARMAGFQPAGVICEIMSDDGSMMRVPELYEFKKKHGLKMVTVADLIEFRMRTEKLIERITDTRLPTRYGFFKMILYRDVVHDESHIALVMGEPSVDRPVLVRVHSECLTGDVFHSMRCDCGQQLEKAMRQISDAGEGIILYMRQEGRGIGLANKIKSYHLQDHGYDTVDANICLGFKDDERDYGIGAQILRDLGITELKLMTNNPRKFVALKGYGLKITDRVPIEVEPNNENKFYLMTKQQKMGHLLHINESSDSSKKQGASQ